MIISFIEPWSFTFSSLCLFSVVHSLLDILSQLFRKLEIVAKVLLHTHSPTTKKKYGDRDGGRKVETICIRSTSKWAKKNVSKIVDIIVGINSQMFVEIFIIIAVTKFEERDAYQHFTLK